jgi:hypothetical protein
MYDVIIPAQGEFGVSNIPAAWGREYRNLFLQCGIPICCSHASTTLQTTFHSCIPKKDFANPQMPCQELEVDFVDFELCVNPNSVQ